MSELMAEKNTPSPIAEISHEPSKFDAFLEQNQLKLIILAVLVTLAAVGILVFKGLGEIKEQKAGSQLASAQTEEELRAVMAVGNDKVKATSLLLIADQQAEEDKAAALETLNQLLGNYTNSAVVADAKLRIAKLKIDLNKLEEAESDLKNILASSEAEYTKPIAQALLADLMLTSGRLSESKNIYMEAGEQAKSALLKQYITVGAEIADVAPPIVIVKERVVEPDVVPDSLKKPEEGSLVPAEVTPARQGEEPVTPEEGKY